MSRVPTEQTAPPRREEKPLQAVPYVFRQKKGASVRFERVPSGKMPRAFSWLRMLAALVTAAPARFTVRLNLPGGSHDEAGQRVGEMSVLGEVMRGTAGRSNHRNRILVRYGWPRVWSPLPWDSFCPMDSPSQR